jgi:hypothetical protein
LILNSNYDITIPPQDFMQILTLDLFFKQIVKLDQTNQILVSSVTLAAFYFDQRLAWNITEYPIVFITLKATQIWLPDLYVINSADLNAIVPFSSSNLVFVTFIGQVYMYYPPLNSKYFNLYLLIII